MNLQGTTQSGFPYGLIGVVEFNTTTMNDVQLVFAGQTPPAGTSISVPDGDAAQYPGGSGTTRKAYYIPPVLGVTTLPGTFNIKTGGTNPGNDNSTIFVRLYPLNYYVDDNSGGAYMLGAEDENNNIIGLGVIRQRINVD